MPSKRFLNASYEYLGNLTVDTTTIPKTNFTYGTLVVPEFSAPTLLMTLLIVALAIKRLRNF